MYFSICIIFSICYYEYFNPQQNILNRISNRISNPILNNLIIINNTQIDECSICLDNDNNKTMSWKEWNETRVKIQSKLFHEEAATNFFFNGWATGLLFFFEKKNKN